MEQELGYASATPLEQMLIKHIVLCYVRLTDTEWAYEAPPTNGALTLAQAQWWERKLAFAQTRYLRAVETLARIRKLGINVQINVGAQQIVTG
jgi:hypothetical protein